MAPRRTGQARWREHAARWLALAGVALALNAAWEYAQLPLYAGGGDLPTWIMVRATVIDGLLVTAAATFGALVARRTHAGLGWAVLVGALAATAVFIELRAVTTGRWEYTAAMPTIGVVGLSPLLQLPTTGALAALVTRPWQGPID